MFLLIFVKQRNCNRNIIEVDIIQINFDYVVIVVDYSNRIVVDYSKNVVYTSLVVAYGLTLLMSNFLVCFMLRVHTP